MVEGKNFHHMFQSQYSFEFVRKKSQISSWGSSGPFEKVILSREKCQIRNFCKMAKMKNGQNLANFGQNGSRFCTPAESSQNRPLLFFDQKNLFTNKTAGGHFVFLPKMCFLTLGAPCTAPKQTFFQKWSQKFH